MKKVTTLKLAHLMTGLAIATAIFAQQPLTSDTVLKMVKSGISEDIIVGMVNSQPGNYTVGPDALISMKQEGVPDRIVAAMVSRSGSVPAADVHPDPVQPLVLNDATPVRLRLTRNLSSAEATSGERVDFEVLDDVSVDNVVVIRRGATALGTVTEAEHKKRMARGGKLNVTIDSVRLADGEKAALRAVKESSGGGHTGAMTAGIVATALVAWPAAPFFLLMHGKDTTIAKGTEIAAYTDGEVKLDRRKLVASR